MNYLFRRFGWLFGFALVLCVAISSAAVTAEEFVRSKHSELTALLEQPKSAAREEKISSILDQVFDYDELAKRSLGDDWSAHSDSEKQEFQRLLERLVKQSYRKNLGKTIGWDVTYDTTSTVEGGLRVPTVATNKTDKRKEPVSVDYLVHEIKGQWKVFDVVVEGSSLVRNYNSQFRKVIRKQGFSELITRMKRRAEKGSG
jgi:phospholipid transport system substrate-binding protein